jgi:hypothetical protein
MNYLNIYNKICERGKVEREIDYYETHHIKPKCVGGDNTSDNLTKLTAREHYIVHLLLTKIYPKEPLLRYAFIALSMANQYQFRYTQSKHYEQFAKIRSDLMTNSNPMKNAETVKKMSDTRKRMIAEGLLGNPMDSPLARKKISVNMKNNNPMSRFPEKNHTVKRTVVYYDDGTIKEFAMKKQFMDTLNGLTHMQKRYKIEKNDLKEFGVIKIERFNKEQG